MNLAQPLIFGALLLMTGPTFAHEVDAECPVGKTLETAEGMDYTVMSCDGDKIVAFDVWGDHQFQRDELIDAAKMPKLDEEK